jgi:NADPH-dependent 2,4-dienoyl-CoA reductase/sulfur reductase-like enzyme
VLVIGGGQMALEGAALLHENGADVEVIMRQPKVNYLDQKAAWLKSEKNPLRPLLYAPTDVGPPGYNWIVATPDLFRRLPRPWQEKIAYRSIRPAGAAWLVPRLREVRITVGKSVKSAAVAGKKVALDLGNGDQRTADHVMLATGFQVDVSRYGFLAPDLLKRVRAVDGYPILSEGLESTVPGLHFLGAPAAYSFGPLCRFVAGTPFAARALTRKIAGKKAAVQWNVF